MATEKSEKVSEVLQRVRLAQEHLGWNDSRLAKALGVSKSYVSRLFSGSRRSIPLEILRGLKESHGINPHWIETGEGVMVLPKVSGELQERESETVYKISRNAAVALSVMDDEDIQKYLLRDIQNPGSMPEEAYGAFRHEWARRTKPPTPPRPPA
jgi:transcriptional regulator with XRE-family HTH domain